MKAVSMLVIAVCLMSGCGGTKLLKEPEPLVVTQPLATASSAEVRATLDWVIFRDGPGTWARNADWDQYLIRVENLGGESLEVTRIRVIDTLGIPIGNAQSRKELVKASKETERRYKDQGLKVKAGAGGGMLVAAGAVTAVSAASIGAAAVYGGTAAAGIAVTGLVLAPVLAVGGVMRGVNNSKVNTEIESRQTLLPVELQIGEEKGLTLFFPLSPSPQRVEITYVTATGEHTLVIDTQAALNGLHLPPPEA